MRWQILAAIAVISLASTACAREWTDATGRYHVDARLLQCHEDTVWLEKPNSRLVLVPLAKLSESDRAYVARECPGQIGTRVEAAPATQPAEIARQEQPVTAPAVLERKRNRAAFHFASLARQPDDMPEELEAAEELPGPTPAAGPGKFIYSGRCGTFHLVGNLGTGAYWYGGKHYLAMLFKAGEDANYLYYDSNHPDGQIIQWYFSKTERCCKFWVWKRTESGHGHYERENREIPN